MTRPDERYQKRLTRLAGDVQEWKDSLDHVSTRCECRLDARPGFHSIDNAACTAGRRCRAMTVLVVRTHMGMVGVNTRHLAAADIPGMVRDLADLMADLSSTTDWLTFGQRLQSVVSTGQDPDHPSTRPL